MKAWISNEEGTTAGMAAMAFAAWFKRHDVLPFRTMRAGWWSPPINTQNGCDPQINPVVQKWVETVSFAVAIGAAMLGSAALRTSTVLLSITVAATLVSGWILIPWFLHGSNQIMSDLGMVSRAAYGAAAARHIEIAPKNQISPKYDLNFCSSFIYSVINMPESIHGTKKYENGG